MEIRFARSATKHRISRARSRFVVEQAKTFFGLPAGAVTNGIGERLLFVGDDAEDVALEVVAVRSPECDFLVIHAMDLRGKYRSKYEEAMKWPI